MEPITQTGKGRRLRRRELGFTLIEMMIVMAIIVILVSLAIPAYQKAIIRAKESVLHNNLTTMRQVIDEYTYDKKKAPQALADLVSAGYLREIPLDPITGSNDTWHVIMEDALQAVDQTEPGIFDVKSGSDKTGLDGTPYADW
ncbi:MAG TPA: prepilin-type N-terminal cleavage/methylation domain-containing protein [Bryobacteraceae bacterium]|jgi:general secretion pathway protein G|nr:prepilin-type N-terminal cleavage/methylation domain-containing protein [Bryobacteraceae bacterium]